MARLHKVNLDLLPVLHELLRTRSVTRTAQSLGITQPAVSRALRQLRGAFDDQLLISAGRDARLTERAETLIAPLGRALGELDLLLKPAGPFDPATEAVHLVINTADYVTQLLAPILAEICAREAPHVVLEFTWTGTRTAEDLAKIDFMIGPRAFGETLGKKVGRLPLWRDEMVCIAAAANEAIPARLTPAGSSRPCVTSPSGAVRARRRTCASSCSRPRRSRRRRSAPPRASWCWARSSGSRTASLWCRARWRGSWRARKSCASSRSPTHASSS